MDKPIPKEIYDRIEWTKDPHKSQGLPKPQIQHSARECDDCGKLVENRRTNIVKNTSPWPHCKESCVNCQLIRHPETGEFTLTRHTNYGRLLQQLYKDDK
jgi:hypothetical protein